MTRAGVGAAVTRAGVGRAAGVYVHVPFCRHRCGYCDFAVHTGAHPALRRRYVEAVEAHLKAVAAAGPRAVAPPGAASDDGAWPQFGTLFVGGGTPTQLAAGDLARLLRAVRDALPLAGGAEVTVEANPEDVDEACLAALVEAGLTRVSVGAQSTAPHVLAFLDRRHHPEAVPRAVEAARAAGVASVSLDLMYGAPAERDEDWRASLDAAVGLGVDHVSCYALTLEPNTPYAAQVRAGAKPAPDDDTAAERMTVAAEVLAAAGLQRYEISNWARPGHASRHNRLYWALGDYLAFGAGAHGHWAGRRWWNVRPTPRYTDRVLAGASPLGGAEVLDAARRNAERLLLGLRTTGGVARRDVRIDPGACEALVAAGLLAPGGERLRLTAAGMAVGDAVTLRLLP